MKYIDANALYYAFSTIAQAGAGAFAFVSAFVLYRLQTADQRILASANHMAEVVLRPPASTKAKGYAASREYDELIKTFKFVQTNHSNDLSLCASYTLIEKEVTTSKELTTRFRGLVAPTAVLLSASVFLILIVNIIDKSQACAAALSLADFSLFVCLLISQARLLIRCL